MRALETRCGIILIGLGIAAEAVPYEFEDQPLGNCIGGYNHFIWGGLTLDSCKCLCDCMKDQLPCKSLDFDTVENKCYLSRMTKDEVSPGDFKACDNMQHSQLINGSAESQFIFKDYGMSTCIKGDANNIGPLWGFTFESCKCACGCLKDEQSCRSVDYYHSMARCYLSPTVKADHTPAEFESPCSDHNSYQYSELVNANNNLDCTCPTQAATTCPTAEPDVCNQYLPTTGRVHSPLQTAAGLAGPDQCATLCAGAADCVAFDFNPTSGECRLGAVGSLGVAAADAGFQHYS